MLNLIPKPKKRKKSNKHITEISPETHALVNQRDGGRCVVCGSRLGTEQHHINPRSKLGAGSVDNLVTLCKQCHYVKLHGMGDYLTKVRIFEYMINLGHDKYRKQLEILQYKEGKLNETRNL